LPDEEIERISKEQNLDDKFVFLWNNRNARRKHEWVLIIGLRSFVIRLVRDKAVLIMHTDPKDPYGQDLEHLLMHFGANKGQILLI
jgi:hypothetical protein